MDKKNIIRALSLFLLFGLTACSGGKTTDSGGTQIASGTIIGFGSVIVNGVEFSRKTGLADDRVTLGFDNITSASEKDLRIGMTVNIRGTINNATGTGEYESIEFQPELRGPLGNVDPTAGTLTIMGRAVQVDANNTNFESISSDLATIKSELQAEHPPELEISGNLDNVTGILHATRIARKAPDFNALPVKIVQIKGDIAPDSVIGDASGGTFAIGTVKVNFTAAGLGSNPTSDDIASGSVVEVKGILNDDGTIVASQIEKKNPVDAVVNDIVNIRGTANGGGGGNTFTIDGPNGAITVNSASTPTTITDGATLEVEGRLLADGSVDATKVKVSLEVEKTVKLEGNAAAGAFNTGAQVLTLNGVPVAISASTRLLDNDGLLLDQAHFAASIASGTHLQIAALFNRTTNKITASQVQISTGNKGGGATFIQGPVTATASPQLTLMGTIIVDTSKVSPALGFEDNRTGTAVKFPGQGAFFAALTSDGFTTVKAKGTIVVVGTIITMNASEVEIEQPQ